MSKLKKSLAMVAVLAIASSALVSCGGSSSTADSSSKAESSKAAESSAEESSAAESSAAAAELTNDDPTLSVLSWTDNDLKNMFKVLFDENSAYTADNVKWVQVGSGGEEARDEYVNYFNGGEDCDLFCLEADWILDYIEKDEYTAPLTDLGFTKDDLSHGYSYVTAIGTDSKGNIKGSSWQATPGGYVYRTDLAEQYLGAKTPAEMQAFVKDWDTFTATAKKLQEDGHKIAMADTLGGMWQVSQYNKGAAWVKDGKLVVDDYCTKYLERAKEYYEKGYVTQESQWSGGWNAIMQDDSTMGAFLCTWCFGKNGTLNGMEGNSDTPDDATEWVIDGPTGGKFNITEGPEGWAWGGTWLALSTKCNTKKSAHDFVEFFTVNPDTMKKYALYASEFVNNKETMKSIIDEGTNKNAYLGGQDQFAVLFNQADKIDMSYVTEYDSVIKGKFNDAAGKYAKGEFTDADAAIADFKAEVKDALPNITVE